MSKQNLNQQYDMARLLASRAVAAKRRRATGYGTDFGPANLATLIDIADNCAYDLSLGGSGDKWLYYHHAKYHHNRANFRNWLGGKDSENKGHTRSRIKFGSTSDAKKAGSKMRAIHHLGVKLKEMIAAGENVQYTTDSQYRAQGYKPVKATMDLWGYHTEVTYAIPFDEERLASQLEKQNFEAEALASVANFTNEAAKSFEEAAQSTANATENVLIASKNNQETEKTIAQTDTSRSLRYIGIAAICAAVVVAAVVIVKKVKK